MFLSKWLAAAAALAMMPSAAVAATGDPIQTYTPPTHELELPPVPVPMLHWRHLEKPTTFYWNVTDSHEQNWIGIWYAYSGEPVNGTKITDPLLWAYAPNKTGTVQLPTKGFPERPYRAYIMAADSYRSIAAPVDFNTGRWEIVRWFSYDMTLPPARQAVYWTYDASKMVNVAGDARNYYTLIYCTGDHWVRATRQGILYGTPTRDSLRVTHLALKVQNPRGMHAYMELTVEVRDVGAQLVTRLSVMSLNLWRGGTNVDGYHAKQLGTIAKAKPDIIALQETDGIHALRIAYALGYYAHQTADAAILARYPIVESLNSTAHSVGVRLALDGDKQQVVVWNAHFDSDKYGPYGFCFGGKNESEVLADEAASGRAAEAEELAAMIKPYVDKSDQVPVFVTGGFGSPSHLDYTAGTTDFHCGAGDVRWPTSWALTRTGLRDAYRAARPDPVADAGNTWSPIVPVNADHGGQKEPQDRIDFVYYAGAPLRLDDAFTFLYSGHVAKPEPKHKGNYWTSDHAGLIAWFKLGMPVGGPANVTDKMLAPDEVEEDEVEEDEVEEDEVDGDE